MPQNGPDYSAQKNPNWLKSNFGKPQATATDVKFSRFQTIST
jgi:hypothetical protein